MYKYIILFFLTFNLLACESPINDKVKDSDKNSRSNAFNGLEQFYSFSYSEEREKGEEEEVKLVLNWVDGPYSSTTKASSLMVTVFKGDELFSFPDNIELVFNSDMPLMRHGLDSAGYFEKISEGLYINKNIKFQMQGEWVHELLLVDYDQENFDSDLEVARWSSTL